MSAEQVMTADEMRVALERIADAILETQGGSGDLVLVGIERRGPELAGWIADAIRARGEAAVPVLALDVTPYRDDRGGAIDADAAAVILARCNDPTTLPAPRSSSSTTCSSRAGPCGLRSMR